MNIVLRYAVAIFCLWISAFGAYAQDAKRGQYLATAAGCAGCHTEEKKDAVPFAGGRALKTPFGTFYGPNITPHPQSGIGGWSEAVFMKALREGTRPDGAHYYPAFPYTSFTKIVDSDSRDLFAYFRSIPPNARASQPHDLKFPFGFRILNHIWKWLFFTPGGFAPDASKSQELNRGAYLVQALAHCGECHTPRNFLGVSKKNRFLAGGKGPDNKDIPNITPTRLKNMSDSDLLQYLQTGLTADGDVAAEPMSEVITNTLAKLSDPDIKALMGYLRTLLPLPEEK